MKNKLLFIPVFFFLLTATSCKKDLRGNSVTITGSTNDTIMYFYYHSTNQSYCPPIADPVVGYPHIIPYLGNGSYRVDLTEEESNTVCLSITGTIPANQDSTGKTILSIEAYYTKEGNITGFQNIELKRPHEEYKIVYQFSPDTYIE